MPRRVARPATSRDGPGVTPPLPGGGPAGTAQRTRVVVVDDHAMFRSGVKTEIGQRVDVVGEAADVDSAVAVIAETHPDVVLLDVHLPGGGGVEVLRRVHLVDADQKFLALSVSDAAEDVIGVIRGGARGYVTKSINGDGADRRDPAGVGGRRGVLAAAGRLRAGRVLGCHRPRDDRRGPGPAVPAGAGGAAADRPRLRVQGSGQELFISIKTVETHVSSVLRKLQLSNRHQLTRWATDRRLV